MIVIVRAVNHLTEKVNSKSNLDIHNAVGSELDELFMFVIYALQRSVVAELLEAFLLNACSQ
jgi:hypothetical protein